MYFWFILYFFLVNILMFCVFMTSNRMLKKYHITKLSFFIWIMITEAALSLLIFRNGVNFAFILSSKMISGFVIYKGYRNFNLVGLTGTMGSGKSTLIAMVKSRLTEIAIIDSDKINDRLFRKNRFFKFVVRKLFYKFDILNENKEIEKIKIARVIFDPKHKTLKNFYLFWVYLFIFSAIFKKLILVFWSRQFVLAIIDAPMLFETKILKFICFPIITLYIDNDDKLIERILARNPELTGEEIKARIKNQMPVQLKLENSDAIVCNNSSRENLYNAFLVEIYKN